MLVLIACSLYSSCLSPAIFIACILLSPRSGDPDVPASPRYPATGDPNGMCARRFGPTSRYPGVSTSIRPVISGNPYPARMRGRSWTLDHDRRRCCANHDLRICHSCTGCADGEGDSAKGNNHAVFHLHSGSGSPAFGLMLQYTRTLRLRAEASCASNPVNSRELLRRTQQSRKQYSLSLDL
jgi:hypothetical protein